MASNPYMKIWVDKNLERYKAYQKQWRKDNPEKLAAYAQKAKGEYRKDRENYLAYEKAKRDAKKDICKEEILD